MTTTVYHRQHGLEPWCEFDIGEDKDIYDARYAFGIDEPNYPVPAIRYEVEFYGSAQIWVWKSNGSLAKVYE